MKKLLQCLTVLMLAVFAAAAAACVPYPPYYTVDLAYNAEQGTLTLSPAEEDGKYAEGTELTVTVTPKSGYELDHFSVTGITNAAPDADGKYTFTVTEDTTVTATFREETPPVTYTLTLSYDHSQGSVWLSPQSSDNKYEEGSALTVQVVPEDGYEVDTFTVSGHEDAALGADGKYTFTVSADTAVTVTFRLAGPNAKTLSTLQGSVFFDGKMINHDYAFEEEIEMNYTVLFDATQKAIWQTEKFAGGDYYFNAVYVDNGGKIALVTHDEEGKLSLQDSEDDFAAYFNPFALLTPDDFTLAEKNVWELSPEKAGAAAAAITGYEEDIASFRLFLEDGVFVKLQITTERVTNLENYIDSEYEYTYEIKDPGTAAVPQEWLTDYTMTPQHETLKQALTAAASAESYTVTQKRSEEGEDDVNGKIYVTKDAIYEDTEGWENGYTVFDGTVYAFEYDPSTQTTTFGEAYSGITIDDRKALFLFDPLPYSLVGYDGNEQYSVRIPDLFIMEDYGELAGAIAQLFAIGTDQIEYYVYALDCTITLKDGVLYQVHFTYDYGYMGYIREDVTLTFSDFCSTVLPIEINGEPEPEPEPSTDIPSQFVGNFKGLPAGSYFTDGTNYEIEITADAITVKIGENSYTAEIVAYDDYEGFTLTVNGTTYYLSAMGSDDTVDQITFISEDYSVMIKLERVGGETPGPQPSSKIPSQFVGTFQGSASGGTAYEIEITADTITVKIGANSYTAEIEDYDEYEGFTLTVNGKTYYLSSMTYDGKADELMFMSDDDSVMIKLERVGGETPGPQPSAKIPSQFVGTFQGTSDGTAYEIVITADSITVKIGANSYTAEIEDYDEYEGFTLTVNGATYYLMAYGYEETINRVVFMSEDYTLNVTLNRESSALSES